jgi:competence protein ComEA
MFYFDRIQQRLLLIIGAVLLAFTGFLMYRGYGQQRDTALAEQLIRQQSADMAAQSTDVTGQASSFENTDEESKTIKIYLTGQVKSPGILVMSDGDRIADAIEQAGGALPDADLNRINLALKVSDEGMYHVPAIGEEIDKSISDLVDNSGFNHNAKVNINKADQAQLETLNGIGPAKAQKIIDYRNKNGLFQSIEEIMNVSGIGEKTFEGLKDQIEVR